MENQFTLPRTLLIYAIVIPLAFILGFFLIAPDSLSTVMLVGVILLVLALPLFLKHHHSLLIIGWSAYINAFFLPGQPPLWMVLALVSFSISVLQRVVTGKALFVSPKSLTFPLVFLLLVTAVTAYARGGIGFHALGGTAYGAKSYTFIVGAILGYFALTANSIPKNKAMWLMGLFFLSFLTALLSNLVYALGPSFWFLFKLFPAELILSQASQDYGGNLSALTRIEGLSFASTGLYFFVIMRYGIRGTFNIRKPWRMLLFFAAIVGSVYGGFRSIIILFALVFMMQLYWEKLLFSRFFACVLAVGIAAGTVVISYIEKMPLPVQRAFSFLPVQVDRAASRDAMASTEWRLEMWRLLWPKIPEYLWLGKGYSIDATDLYLAEQSVLRGLAKSYEPHMIAGNYHSGPLSTIIPMGIGGVIGLLWLFIAGIRVLYRNYRYGDPELSRINTFLLGYFIVRAVFFIVIFGAFNTELCVFTGVLGMSIAVNGGVRAKPRAQVARTTQPSQPKSLLIPQPA